MRFPLVAIGDSLTMGFQHGAICETRFSYPSLLAHALGLQDFETVNFLEQAGLPLNMEVLLRGIEEEFGTELGWKDAVALSNHIISTLNRIKNYWEENSYPYKKQPNHFIPSLNQSIFSVTVSDAMRVTDSKCESYLKSSEFGRFELSLVPENAFYLAARRVLNPHQQSQFSDCSLLENVEWFSTNGGIEHCIVFLGANNLIGAITDLAFIEADAQDVNKMPYERKSTVYSPELFRKEYQALAKRISNMSIQFCYTSTIPDLTKVPLLQQIEVSTGEFVYTHVWVRKEDFDLEIHPWISEKDLNQVHQYLEEYNKIIKETAKEYNWKVLDLYTLVKQLDDQDFRSVPASAVRAIRNNVDTKYLIRDNGMLKMNTNYPEIDPKSGKLKQGGIFSLDGIHPSTFAYGLIASGFMQLMIENGTKFKQGFDWNKIVSEDGLLGNPPALVNELRYVLQIFSSDYSKLFSKYGRHIFEQILQAFAGKSIFHY